MSREKCQMFWLFLYSILMCKEAKAHPGLYVEPMMMMMMMILMYNYNSALYKFAGSTFQKIQKL